LLATYEKLYRYYGRQYWWPAETTFEIMVGAILTQNTAWTNVEQAIARLRQHRALDARRILQLSDDGLAALLRPTGYFNLKTQRLKNFCRWYLDQGAYRTLAGLDTVSLRQALLSVNGIGPETADDMVLYAFERPVFVIDAYTRRIFGRLGLVDGTLAYEALRDVCEQTLRQALAQRNKSGRVQSARLTRIYNECHALIVVHAKEVCRPRPLCQHCCLQPHCSYYRAAV
jgi:endonuclease-3 related protein